MSTIIAISGAQGSGKTTLLNALKSALPNVIVDDYKVSRAVQEELGVEALSDVTQSFYKMRDFQEKIFDYKWLHDSDMSVKADDRVILVERSFYDIAIYTELWMESYGKLSLDQRQWFTPFKERCINAQSIYSGLIIVHPHPDIPFEEDPNRASEQTRDTFQNKLIQYSTLFDARVGSKAKGQSFTKMDVFCSSIEDRVESVLPFFDCLQK